MFNDSFITITENAKSDIILMLKICFLQVKSLFEHVQCMFYLTIVVLSVVKYVPRPWFLTSLPSSVGFMCCVKDL